MYAISAPKIHNRSFKNVTQSKYLGTTLSDQNLLQEEIKERLNSGNVCYILSRTFYLIICHLETKKLEYTKLYSISEHPVAFT
jgi:hypothetical protein